VAHAQCAPQVWVLFFVITPSYSVANY